MKKIGFIGIGTMGESMCENIIKKSEAEVTVFDVNKEQIQKMVDLGAKSALSVSEVGSNCDYIFIMVPRSEHVRAVIEELLPVLTTGKIVVDMSTIDPEVTKELAQKVGNTGAMMADAPVVKSKPAAIAGELGIYVGGKAEVFEEIKGILSYMGKDIIHMGEIGSGISMKIAHNFLVSQIQNGVNEMLVLAESAGLNMDDVVTAISYGGGQNFYLDSKKDSIKQGDFTPKFSLENMHKDIGLAINLAEKLNINLPGAKLVQNVYNKGIEKNIGKEDFSASIKVVKELTGSVVSR